MCLTFIHMRINSMWMYVTNGSLLEMKVNCMTDRKVCVDDNTL